MPRRASRLKSRASSLLVPWLRRMGPVRSLIIALLATNLLFFGCIQWGEIRGFGHRPDETPPPTTSFDREIRVRLLGRTPKPNIQISITSPFSIPNPTTAAVILPDVAAMDDVYLRPSGDSGIQLGPKMIPASDIMITSQRDASIVVNGQTYRGRLRVMRAQGGLVAINQLDMESYLRGVLRGELPKNFHIESFKAQAVAARTYALYQNQNNAADRNFAVYK